MPEHKRYGSKLFQRVINSHLKHSWYFSTWTLRMTMTDQLTRSAKKRKKNISQTTSVGRRSSSLMGLVVSPQRPIVAALALSRDRGNITCKAVMCYITISLRYLCYSRYTRIIHIYSFFLPLSQWLCANCIHEKSMTNFSLTKSNSVSVSMKFVWFITTQGEQYPNVSKGCLIY